MSDFAEDDSAMLVFWNAADALGFAAGALTGETEQDEGRDCGFSFVLGLVALGAHEEREKE